MLLTQCGVGPGAVCSHAAALLALAVCAVVALALCKRADLFATVSSLNCVRAILKSVASVSSSSTGSHKYLAAHMPSSSPFRAETAIILHSLISTSFRLTAVA